MIKKSAHLILVAVLLLLVFPVIAQNKNTKKIDKLCDKTMKYINKQDYEKASKYVNQIFAIDSTYAKAYVLQGDIYSLTLDAEKSADAYNKAISLNEKPKPMLYYVAAEEEMKCGRYESARQNYENYLNSFTIIPPLVNEIGKQLINCEFSIKAVKTPMKFSPVNMGNAINSEWDEYLPTITADEE